MSQQYMHFQSEYNHENKWLRTTITVSEKTKPYYRLYSGGVNRRFKLASKQHTVFWGCIVNRYSGVWLLRNSISWEKPIIAPITSSNIEYYKSLSSPNHYEYWSTFFAHKLLQTDYSILTQGEWVIKAGIIGGTSELRKQLIDFSSVYQDDGIFLEQVDYISWGIDGSEELIASKEKPKDDSARVKWWRKKVKEAVCPPVLVWFVSPLDAYLIIDGHSRLRAYQLENKQIQLLVLYTYQKKPKHEDAIKARQHMLHSLKCRLKNEEKNIRKNLSLDDVNNMLIQMYDDEYEKYISIGTHTADFDKIWENEVSQFKTDKSINQTHLKGLLTSEI